MTTSQRPVDVPLALVHGLRHTFATELANANVSVNTLMKLLGHESMVTSQRYVDGAGTETRSAAELNRCTTSSTPEESTRDSLTLKRHNTFHG
jgi:hypothetical protein